MKLVELVSSIYFKRSPVFFLKQNIFQTWVLTGDKEETAVNVSFLSGHFAPGLSTIRITKRISLLDCCTALETQLRNLNKSRQEVAQYRYGLVVDGQSLNYALQVN